MFVCPSSYRKIFSSIIRDLCEFDGTGNFSNFHMSGASVGDDRSLVSRESHRGLALQSLHSITKGPRRRSVGFAARIQEVEEEDNANSPKATKEGLSNEKCNC